MQDVFYFRFPRDLPRFFYWVFFKPISLNGYLRKMGWSKETLTSFLLYWRHGKSSQNLRAFVHLAIWNTILPPFIVSLFLLLTVKLPESNLTDWFSFFAVYLVTIEIFSLTVSIFFSMILGAMVSFIFSLIPLGLGFMLIWFLGNTTEADVSPAYFTMFSEVILLLLGLIIGTLIGLVIGSGAGAIARMIKGSDTGKMVEKVVGVTLAASFCSISTLTIGIVFLQSLKDDDYLFSEATYSYFIFTLLIEVFMLITLYGFVLASITHLAGRSGWAQEATPIVLFGIASGIFAYPLISFAQINSVFLLLLTIIMLLFGALLLTGYLRVVIYVFEIPWSLLICALAPKIRVHLIPAALDEVIRFPLPGTYFMLTKIGQNNCREGLNFIGCVGLNPSQRPAARLALFEILDYHMNKPDTLEAIIKLAQIFSELPERSRFDLSNFIIDIKQIGDHANSSLENGNLEERKEQLKQAITVAIKAKNELPKEKKEDMKYKLRLTSALERWRNILNTELLKSFNNA